VHLKSRPNLLPPVVKVVVHDTNPNLGDIFLTPVYGQPSFAYGVPVFSNSQAGPMIVSPNGKLIWFHPEPAGLEATDLQVQRYLGQKVLTYWQGHFTHGHGIGDGVILNSHYQQLAAVHAGNGLQMDMHDFTLGPDGVAYITVYEPVHWNLTSVGGPARGLVEDCVVQEIDIRTGLVMFEWHALGHVPLTDSNSGYPFASHPTVLGQQTKHELAHKRSSQKQKPQDRGLVVSQRRRHHTSKKLAARQPLSVLPGKHHRPHQRDYIYDYFHINRVQVLADGNLLINARNTWAAYDVSHRTGAIIWELGGHQSSFKLGPDVRFAWQHDTMMLANGNIQIFDNEDSPPVRKHSRGIIVGLNFKDHTAKLLHAYFDPKHPILTSSEGDVQSLPGGDKLLGFGHYGFIEEFSAKGKILFEMALTRSVSSYRVYRYPWSATPVTRPAVVASRVAGTNTISIATSWNGATGVRAWRVLAGNSPQHLAVVGTTSATGASKLKQDASVKQDASGQGGRRIPNQGFETRFKVKSSAPYIEVEALGYGRAEVATLGSKDRDILSISRVVAVGSSKIS
jgi:hypothetical protein